MKHRRGPLVPWALVPLALLVACQQAPSVTDIGTVTGGDAYELVGQPVQLVGATVQETVSDRAFWVGPNEARRVLVVVPAETPPVEEGDKVNLNGTVERVPSEPEGFRRLNLGTEAEEVLRLQILYIQVTREDVRQSATRAE